MRLDNSGVDAALSVLGEHMEYTATEPVEIVICGGSALQALGLITRTTRDIDVLALIKGSIDGEPNLLSSEPLPDVMIESAKTVARDLLMPDDWLNSGPTDLLTHGLPEGLSSRLHTRRYGTKLTVHFIDRFDQICFKTYAAINGGGAHHISDLNLLLPSEEEMLSAACWCLTQDASEVFPQLVTSFLEQTGYENVAKKLKSKNQE